MLIESIKHGADILKSGGVIAFPTDTVYGLGADIFNDKAVERIYKIKKRSRNYPFPLLLNNMSQLNIVTDKIPETIYPLATTFWPGGLTVVLYKASTLPNYLSDRPTVAVRIPKHHIPLSLIQHIGNPIIGTSANISGMQNSLTADEVKEQLGNTIDYIIDGGSCPGGTESTIIDLSGMHPTIIRQGIIHQNEIEQVLDHFYKRRNE